MAASWQSLDRRSLIAGLALIGALVPAQVGRAVPPTAAAEQVVQRLVDRLWQLLTEQGVGAVDEQDSPRGARGGYGSHPARALGPGALTGGTPIPSSGPCTCICFAATWCRRSCSDCDNMSATIRVSGRPLPGGRQSPGRGTGTFSCSRACYRLAASPYGSTGGCGIDRRAGSHRSDHRGDQPSRHAALGIRRRARTRRRGRAVAELNARLT